ncbi:MAG: hemolysin [Chaetfec virus UA24_244]|nr:MAG: hemolysin [Chaetfec virus UA24_244]
METGLPITRAEHEEYVRRVTAEMKRMEDENNRQNRRLEKLEDNMNEIIVQQLTALTATIKSVEISVGNMLKEQTEFSDRLKKLESRDGEMWRKVVGYAVTAVVGLVIGFVFSKLGIH